MTHEQFRANLSACLREIKSQKGLSDKNIAETIRVPRRSVTNWVNGAATPNALDYCKLIAAFPETSLEKKIEVFLQNA